jgi:hypothetical protein
MAAALELYGGYSASYLRDEFRHRLSGPPQSIPNGAYHWLDVGISSQARWRSFVWTVGGGITKLVASPAGGPADDDHSADALWIFSPEGWFSEVGLAPTLWSSVGMSF